VKAARRLEDPLNLKKPFSFRKHFLNFSSVFNYLADLAPFAVDRAGYCRHRGTGRQAAGPIELTNMTSHRTVPKRICANRVDNRIPPGVARTMRPLLALAWLAAPAFAAFPNGYTYCKVVTTSVSMVSGSSDLTNYPLTVILTDADLKTVGNGGMVNNANGYDIGFYPDCSGSGAALKWEMETYTPATGAIVAHVLRPTLSHTVNDTIGMYYGNSSISTFQSTASLVWNSNYVGVWHLKDGSTLSASDSTSNSLTGTITTPAASSGKIDGGAAFGPTDRIDMGNITVLNGATAATWSFWVYYNSLNAASRGLLSKWGSSSPVSMFLVSAESSSEIQFALRNAAAINIKKTSGAGLSTGTWYHITCTYAASTDLKIYKNGAVQTMTNPNTDAITSLPSAGTSFQIGYETAESRTALDGKIDEVRISNTVRSADWILTEYRNQSAPATYISAGPRITPGGQRVRHTMTGGL
jgi:hypothetical protein